MWLTPSCQLSHSFHQRICICSDTAWAEDKNNQLQIAKEQTTGSIK
jgi:hypothetical protein